MYKNILRLREEDAAFAAQLAALSENVGSGDAGHVADHNAIANIIKNIKGSLDAAVGYPDLKYTKGSDNNWTEPGGQNQPGEGFDALLTQYVELGYTVIIDDSSPATEYSNSGDIPVGSKLIVSARPNGLPDTLSRPLLLAKSMENAVNVISSRTDTSRDYQKAFNRLLELTCDSETHTRDVYDSPWTPPRPDLTTPGYVVTMQLDFRGDVARPFFVDSSKDPVLSVMSFTLKPEVNISALESDIEALTTVSSTLEGKVSTLESDNSTLSATVSTLESDNVSLNTTVSGLETDFGSLSSANDTLSSTVSTLEGNVATLTSEKEALEGQVSTLESTIGDLTTRLEALEAAATSPE